MESSNERDPCTEFALAMLSIGILIDAVSLPLHEDGLCELRSEYIVLMVPNTQYSRQTRFRGLG